VVIDCFAGAAPPMCATQRCAPSCVCLVGLAAGRLSAVRNAGQVRVRLRPHRRPGCPAGRLQRSALPPQAPRAAPPQRLSQADDGAAPHSADSSPPPPYCCPYPCPYCTLTPSLPRSPATASPALAPGPRSPRSPPPPPRRSLASPPATRAPLSRAPPRAAHSRAPPRAARPVRHSAPLPPGRAGSGLGRLPRRASPRPRATSSASRGAGTRTPRPPRAALAPAWASERRGG